MARKRDENFEEFSDEVADLFGARLDNDVVRDLYDSMTRDLGYPPSGDEVEDYADDIFDYLAEEEQVEDAGESDYLFDEDEIREEHERDLADRDKGEDYYFDEGEEVELSIDTAYGED